MTTTSANLVCSRGHREVLEVKPGQLLVDSRCHI